MSVCYVTLRACHTPQLAPRASNELLAVSAWFKDDRTFEAWIQPTPSTTISPVITRQTGIAMRDGRLVHRDTRVPLKKASVMDVRRALIKLVGFIVRNSMDADGKRTPVTLVAYNGNVAVFDVLAHNIIK